MNYDAAHALAKQIKESEEVREYQRLKEIVEESETTRALIKEYKRLQMAVQMAAMSGSQLPSEEMSRFQQISSLLYAGTDTSQYLMAEMRLQQSLADIYNIIAKASGITLELPGIE
ncbi:MAG: YlbF family regulator [Clostridiales bacterium]|nr:YlbF family regulator [Clostridiales bacterium]